MSSYNTRRLKRNFKKAAIQSDGDCKGVKTSRNRKLYNKQCFNRIKKSQRKGLVQLFGFGSDPKENFNYSQHSYKSVMKRKSFEFTIKKIKARFK